jgi:hypothetical protein
MQQILKGLRRLLVWAAIVVVVGALQWLVGRALDDLAKNGMPLGWLKVLTAPTAPLWVMAGCAFGGLAYVFWPIISRLWSSGPEAAQASITGSVAPPPDASSVQESMPSGHLDFNPLDSYFSKKSIRLIDLLLSGQFSISDKTFEDCYILGPAVIGLMGNSFLDSCTFIIPPGSDPFIEAPENTFIVGPMALNNCIFRRCKLTAIGIVASKAQIENMKRGIVQTQG